MTDILASIIIAIISVQTIRTITFIVIFLSQQLLVFLVVLGLLL